MACTTATTATIGLDCELFAPFWLDRDIRKACDVEWDVTTATTATTSYTTATTNSTTAATSSTTAATSSTTATTNSTTAATKLLLWSGMWDGRRKCLELRIG